MPEALRPIPEALRPIPEALRPIPRAVGGRYVYAPRCDINICARRDVPAQLRGYGRKNLCRRRERICSPIPVPPLRGRPLPPVTPRRRSRRLPAPPTPRQETTRKKQGGHASPLALGKHGLLGKPSLPPVVPSAGCPRFALGLPWLPAPPPRVGAGRRLGAGRLVGTVSSWGGWL